eukprot:CAMPEP_0197032262 /NCGR_PEP_ID=MMETSP1384-20130603/10983_1 /TAXON_ID=29189 /ORGANISM="Ammonia sp." /LENGTH=310 /DNA_ID=CAMNT_0042461897 /DNA_START=50 /DNA_END=982 /DNA_ORIENTATION=+
MAAVAKETAPLVTKTVPTQNSTLRGKNLCVIVCLIAGCILISYQMIAAAPKLNEMVEQVSSDEIERVLFTNNPNEAYLCDADFLFEDVNTDPDTYQFACAMISSFGTETSTVLECPDGYVLDCLVGASYGRTAGSCEELVTSTDGCGFAYSEAPIVCEADSIVCDSAAEFEECVDSQTQSLLTADSACDCVPMCACDLDHPQFYNVADCFGDTTSTICSGKPGDWDPQNLYMPYAVWLNDCEGKQQCELSLSNVVSNVYSCWNEEFQFENVYYSAVNGVAFGGFHQVVLGQMLPTCAYMDFKVLSVCKAV